MSIDRFDTVRFESALPADKTSGEALWEFVGIDNGERVYNVQAGPYARIVVRSSIDESGIAADAGEDSIRMWLQIMTAEGQYRNVKKLDSWTTRVNGWENRMTDKLRELYGYGARVKRSIPKCAKCGKMQGFWFTKSGKNEGRPASKCFDCDTGFVWMDGWENHHNSIEEEIPWSDEPKELESAPSMDGRIPMAEPEPEQEPMDLFEQLRAIVNKSDVEVVVREPSEQQMAAIYAPLDVPIRVPASPGSGKTFTIERRVKYMIQDEGIDPNEILVVTFTKAMSQDLGDRIAAMVPEIRNTPAMNQICTIHAACNRILAAEGYSMSIPKSWEMKRLLQDIAKDLWPYTDASDKSTCRPSWEALYTAIANAKNLALEPNYDQSWYEMMWGGYHAERLTPARYRFDKAMKAKKNWHFADMLYEMEIRLKNDRDFRERVQSRFKYVIVDEGQDTNGQSMRILTEIAKPENQIFIVGDADQLLFRFAGATPELNMYDGFTERYPDGNMYFLETNYRSTKNIVNRSNNLIARNYESMGGPYEDVFRKASSARDGAPDGEDISFVMYADQTEEAYGVAESIFNDIQSGKRQPGDIFVGSRTRGQLGYIEVPLTRLGVPFINITGGSFWMLRHVRFITEYLRLVQTPSDQDAFKHIYNVASVNMRDRNGEYSATRWLGRSFLRDMRGVWDEGAARDAAYNYFGWRDGINDLIWTIAELSRACTTPADGVRWLIDNVVGQYLREEEGVSDDEGIGKLNDLESVYGVASGFDTLEAFLGKVDDALDAAKAAKEKRWDDYVVLSTVHRLKGMERPVVYGVGWCEGTKDDGEPIGMLPHTFSLTSPPETGPLSLNLQGRVEDERCIAFVLVTRAEEEVHLSGFVEGWRGEMERSRFINELL